MPATVMSGTDIRVRRRRRLAVSAMLGRASGLVATAVAVFDWSRQRTPHATDLVAGGLIAIVLMLVTIVVSAWGYRMAGRAAYGPLITIERTLDCVVITSAVVFFSAVNHTTSWPILVIPILLAGYLRHNRGALGMWLLTAGAYAAVPWLVNGRLQADLPMAAGLLFTIGIAAGTQGKAFARQVQELHAARAALSHQASHDALTGLANRSLLTDQAAAHAGEQIAVLVLDLDHFKSVNDRLGHAAGDELLRAVAVRLQASIGPRDVASRTGGDEFVVLLAGASAAQAAATADRIRSALAEPVQLGGLTLAVQASIGVAHRGAGGDADLQALTEQADRAVYADKSTSRRTPARVPVAAVPLSVR